MSIFKSSNPVLSEKTFRGTVFEGIRDESQEMTMRGTINKFGFVLLLMLASSVFSWNYFYAGKDPLPLMIVSVFGGLGVVLIMAFKKEWSPYLSPLHGLLQGLFVGSVSALSRNSDAGCDDHIGSGCCDVLHLSFSNHQGYQYV
jgi:uncharacterized YccA/Bax inhibitor family protein